MLKKRIKFMSLLIAASVVVGSTPVMAADYARVEAQEGTVYGAKAVGNGIFIIDGELNGEDSQMYSVTNGKDFEKLEDLDSGDTLSEKLVDKYVEIDDDCYVDFTDNYKVTNDKVREDLVDDAATALRKKIKKDNDGRFNEDYYDDSVDAEPKRDGESSTFFDGFSAQWSRYKYKLDKPKISGEEYSSIYADLEGNYIDADYNLGYLRVSTTDDSVTIKNTDDTYEIEENGTAYELKAEIKEGQVLSEAYGEIYRTAYLTIYRKEKGADDTTYEPITNELYFGGSTDKYKVTDNDSAEVIQVLSKEQASDDIDGIKYPKKSSIYFMKDEDGKDVHILGFGDTADESSAGYGYGVFTTSMKGITSFYVDLQNNDLYAQTLKLKSKGGFNYIDVSDDDSCEDYNTWAIAGGDLWCLDDGYIKTWDGDESFKKVYKVDGSMNEISINDENNMVVWNEDDEVYSIIYKPSQSEVEKNNEQVTTDVAATVNEGWTQNTDNTWCYYKNGVKATGWVQSPSSRLWYYMDNQGVMMSNKWVKYKEKWYYLTEDGHMARGWILDKNKWYYLDKTGVMLSNTTVSGYVLGSDGAWIK